MWCDYLYVFAKFELHEVLLEISMFDLLCFSFGWESGTGRLLMFCKLLFISNDALRSSLYVELFVVSILLISIAG